MHTPLKTPTLISRPVLSARLVPSGVFSDAGIVRLDPTAWVVYLAARLARQVRPLARANQVALASLVITAAAAVLLPVLARLVLPAT